MSGVGFSLIVSGLCMILFAGQNAPARATITLATATDPAFAGVWNIADGPVARHQVNRSWTWGPQPFAAQTEFYQQGPNGIRSVLYWDKARMEITDPNGNRNSQWFVTTGLLTKELVSGKMQLADNNFANYGPAQVGVAGDPDGSSPTYADFASRTTLNGNDNRAGNRTGQVITDSVARGGRFGQDGRFGGYGVRVGTYESTLGHNIPAPLWSWMNSLPSPWLSVLGFPISEAYWARVNIGGQPKDVLMQLFERRVVTYNPVNSPEWQVEYGNIGQHYYVWRYSDNSRTLQGIEGRLAQKIQNERSHSPGLRPLFSSQPSADKLSSPVDGGATLVARYRTNDMATKHYFDHAAPDGKNYTNLLSAYNIGRQWAGEIISKVCGSDNQDLIAQMMFDAWLDSPSHAAAIRSANFEQFSVSVSHSSDGCYYAAGIFIGR